MSFACVDGEALFARCPPPALALALFLLPLLWDSLSSERRGLTEVSSLDFLSVQCLSVGLCVCSYLLLEEACLVMVSP